MTVNRSILCCPVGLFTAVFLLLCGRVMADESTVQVAFTQSDSALKAILDRYSEEVDPGFHFVWVAQSDLQSRLLNNRAPQDLPHVLIAAEDILSSANNLRLSSVHVHQKYHSTIRNTDDYASGVRISKGNQLVLYYNKQLAPVPATAWKDLPSTVLSIGKDDYLIGWSILDMYWAIPFITAFSLGTDLEPQKLVVSSKTSEAFAFIWRAIRAGEIDLNCGYVCNNQRFTQGRQPYLINGTWAYHELKTALNADLGVARLPTIDGRPMKSYFSYQVIAFPNDSLNSVYSKRLARFVEYMLSDKVQKELLGTITSLPVKEVCSTNAFGLSDCAQTADHQILLASLKQSEPMPNDPNMSIFWEALLKGFVRQGASPGGLSEHYAHLFMGSYYKRMAEKNVR